ncbi:MAG TPA: 16S rRNA (guanine(527)-N(7))-methyltransferase RsmG [Candidatus Kryptonia bacterium]|nr:16S rRNA (guanine(527)-N(7))-methyltransferase RsmG [Candidatus Kryptonia bacterium]
MPLTSAEQRELQAAARPFGVELLPDHIDRIGRYLDLLFQWRKHARLVSQRQTRSDILTRHIADSFALIAPLRGRRRIADVGSGAGLPGIPVAVVLPSAHITLIESNQRKANFLREVIRQLAIANVAVAESRVERLQADHLFDAVVSRAVGTIENLLRNARPRLQRSGVVIAMKGPSVEREIVPAAIAALGFAIESRVQYRLEPGENRVLVVMRFT